jgi:hypothetical protein
MIHLLRVSSITRSHGILTASTIRTDADVVRNRCADAGDTARGTTVSAAPARGCHPSRERFHPTHFRKPLADRPTPSSREPRIWVGAEGHTPILATLPDTQVLMDFDVYLQMYAVRTDGATTGSKTSATTLHARPLRNWRTRQCSQVPGAHNTTR